MFDNGGGGVDGDALRSWLDELASDLDPQATDAERLDEITLLERVKSACAARQARLSVAFDESQRATQVAMGVPVRELGRGVAEQIALARRESPSRGSRHLGMAKALVDEMPDTLIALAAGDVSEYTATILVQETACLTAEDRRGVDAELAGRLGVLGPRRVRREAWAAACRLDPSSAAARCRKAVNDRFVSVRPAPDTMTYLTALLPVRDGVAVFASLNAAAATAKATGDPRGRGQVMADTLVDRLTAVGGTAAGGTAVGDTALGGTAVGDTALGGTAVGGAAVDGVATGGASAGDAFVTGVPVEVHLVLSDETLLRGGDAPGLLTCDPAVTNTAADLIPAPVARDLVRRAAKVWVRRLYASPDTGQLVAMESSRRVFDGNLRRMLVLRDQTCRTPWCEAPIRHADHIHPDAAGGATSFVNGQGLCARCNQTKSLAGWSATRVTSPDGHAVRTITPTGHSYGSTAPPLLDAPSVASSRHVGSPNVSAAVSARPPDCAVAS